MHELAITQSVVEAVRDDAGDTRVSAVHVRVGKLSGVVPDSMRFCFELICAGTNLEGATLMIEEPAGEGSCRTCGASVPLRDLVLLCPCGSLDVDIVHGRELSVRSYEVA